jgi:hypothetical protein
MRPRLLVAAPVAAVLLIALSPSSAAQPPPPVPPEQSEVRGAVEGNATNCQQAGLPGNLIHFVGGPASSFNGTVRGTVTDERVLDVQVIDNAVISGVLVDGGPSYYIYRNQPYVGLTPPVDTTQNVQQIMHWMVCGWELPSANRPAEGAVVPYGAPTVPTELPAGLSEPGVLGGDGRIAPGDPASKPQATTDGGPPWALVGLASVGVASVGAVIVARRRHTNEM